MGNMNLKEMEDSIRNASPLDLASTLQQVELIDKKNTRAVVDEIYEEFNSDGDRVEKVVVPIFLSIADGFLESTAATRKLRKKGLTATRLVNECRSFSYDRMESEIIISDGYTESKNAAQRIASGTKRQAYTRSVYEDKKRLITYKANIFANNGGRINATDEYSGQRNVYQNRSNPDARRNIEKYKHDHQAEVDHIVPLKRIHKQFETNYALTDEDIKSLANEDSNLALTSARINRGAGAPGAGGKFDKTNTELVKDQRKRKKEGAPNLGLTKEAEEKMLQMEKDSQKIINSGADKKVLRNIAGRGTGNTKKIWGKTAINATKQAKDNAIGNVMLFIIKPLYYEISDIFKAGLKEGVEAGTTKQALKIRFGRVKDYVLANASKFLKGNLLEFIKGFVSSLVEGFISLFVGIFKQVLKVIKEGVKIFSEAGIILFGKNSKQMTAAQKGDAIIKILGGSVLAICGIGIEALLNKIGVPESGSVILSTMFSGIASTMFMLLLDKIDLFDVKAEKRRMRIDEIFDLRIKDIKEAQSTCNNAALETMRSQSLQFAEIKNVIWKGVDNDDTHTINDGLMKLALFMKVDLGYSNREEFVEKWDNGELDLSL